MTADKFLNSLKNMPEESFDNFLTILFENKYTKTVIARTEDIPITILELLIEDEDWMVLRGVAQNPATPGYLLDKLADTVLAMIKRLEARFELIHDSRIKTQIENYIKVLVAISEHANTLSDTFDKFLATHNFKLFEAIARNHNTTADTLDKLTDIYLQNYAHHSNTFALIAQNPNILVTTIIKITNSLITNLRIDHKSIEALNVIAKLPITPDYLLTKIANAILNIHDKYYYERNTDAFFVLYNRCYLALITLASNCNTPDNILDELAKPSRDSRIYNAARRELARRHSN